MCRQSFLDQFVFQKHFGELSQTDNSLKYSNSCDSDYCFSVADFPKLVYLLLTTDLYQQIFTISSTLQMTS